MDFLHFWYQRFTWEHPNWQNWLFINHRIVSLLNLYLNIFWWSLPNCVPYVFRALRSPARHLPRTRRVSHACVAYSLFYHMLLCLTCHSCLKLYILYVPILSFVLLCSHASRTLFAIQFLLVISFCEGEICYGWKKYKYASNTQNWRSALIKNLICLNYFQKTNPDTNPNWECFRTYLAQFVEEKNYFSVKLHLSKSCYTTKKFQLWKFLQETLLYIYIYICI